MEMPSRRTNNFPESGRGRSHVTPTIFGSTVGYPSDSLASCMFSEYIVTIVMKTRLHNRTATQQTRQTDRQTDTYRQVQTDTETDSTAGIKLM